MPFNHGYNLAMRDPTPPSDPAVLVRMLSADTLMQLSAMSANPDFVPGIAYRTRLRAFRLINCHNQITPLGFAVLACEVA